MSGGSESSFKIAPKIKGMVLEVAQLLLSSQFTKKLLA